MPVMTTAFCRHCKWRSSEVPVNYGAAGAPCPVCGTGISAVHYDPSFTGTDSFGRHYVEAQEVHTHLTDVGVPTVNPAGIPIPAHR